MEGSCNMRHRRYEIFRDDIIMTRDVNSTSPALSPSLSAIFHATIARAWFPRIHVRTVVAAFIFLLDYYLALRCMLSRAYRFHWSRRFSMAIFFAPKRAWAPHPWRKMLLLRRQIIIFLRALYNIRCFINGLSLFSNTIFLARRLAGILPRA